MRRKENKNQLTIFDFMKKEAEILYYKGDVLFQQLKGDVEQYTVTGETGGCVMGNPEVTAYRLRMAYTM